METLRILEDKIVTLIDLVNSLRAENLQLSKNNQLLEKQLVAMEKLASTETQTSESLQQERKQAKMAVEDLIKVIDSLVEPQAQL